MNNIKSVLDQVKKHFPKQFKIAYRFPYTFLILTHPDFTDDEEENEIKFCNLLNIEPQYIRDISNLSLLSLECLSQEDFDKREIKNRGTYWSELRIEEELDLLNKTKTENEDPLKVIHFFGYKGGQGRSSVLTALSLNLMKYGWKVLVIDADFEAPSLDLIYNKDLKLENTLLGLYLGKKINAINYDSKPSGGSIDIIGAKPSLIYNEMSELEDDWSIEYSGMTLQANVNPATIQILAKGLQSFAKENLYDIVLVDQRSGMSISSITWINELIGQLVLFTRLDNQWQHSYQFLKSLVLNSNSSDIPIISQKPYMTKDLAPIDKDHFERQKEDLKFLFVKNKQIKEGLDIDDISVGDINANFLDWQYDPSYRDNLLPDTEQILSENLLVLQKLRSILEIESDKSKFIKPDYSGIKDEGLLILTDALNKLLNKNNDINYIYGRKGTGKTKIFAELVSRNLAKPLIAQDDYFLERKNAEGINGRSDTVKNIIWSFNKEIKKLENSRIEDIDGLVENFWWCIFLTAIETISKHGSLPNKVFEEEFKKKYENFKKESSNYSTKLKSILVSQEEKITFCIDGLETTFDVYYINYYVKALYGVMNTILTDSYFEKIQVKLFLRKDLKPEFIQNSEQKDSIELVWTEQAILNFFVSRLLAKTEGNYLRDILYNKIKDKKDSFDLDILSDTLGRAELPIKDCISILREIFPNKIGSGNSNIDSFFLSYFTDTEKSMNIPYYPRVYQSFVKELNKDIKQGNSIDNKIIIQVYNRVAQDYLDSLKHELKFLLEFAEKESENEKQIKKFIESFQDERTPFERMKLIIAINKKMGGDVRFREKVSKAFDSMKNMGIFEETNNNKWRVGRLVKAAFKMTYDR